MKPEVESPMNGSDSPQKGRGVVGCDYPSLVENSVIPVKAELSNHSLLFGSVAYLILGLLLFVTPLAPPYIDLRAGSAG
jgi:hypothetical protein